MNATPPLLQVSHLHFSHPGRRLWQGLSASLGAGATLLRGGDGSGKTTLLRLLAGELAPQQGRLVLQGVGSAAHPAGYCQQVFWHNPRAHGLDGTSGAAWLATLPARHSAWDASALAAHVQGWGLGAHLHKPLCQLSSGSQRKVLMAAALASGAALTLIDEPTAGLDRPSIAYLQQALAGAAQSPQRAIVVAHYEALEGVPWQQVLDLSD